MNTRRGKYVTFINERDISKGLDWIKEKAKQQYSEIDIFGTEQVDLTKFNGGGEIEETKSLTVEELNFDGDKFLQSIPPCVADILKKGNPGHHERGFILNYLITRGYQRSLIVQILKKYLNEDKFHHCVDSESDTFRGKKCEDQLNYMMRKYKNDDEWSFNSCESIKANGWCKVNNCGKHPTDSFIKNKSHKD
jgi:DNA primase large subunit